MGIKSIVEGLERPINTKSKIKNLLNQQKFLKQELKDVAIKANPSTFDKNKYKGILQRLDTIEQELIDLYTNSDIRFATEAFDPLEKLKIAALQAWYPPLVDKAFAAENPNLEDRDEGNRINKHRDSDVGTITVYFQFVNGIEREKAAKADPKGNLVDRNSEFDALADTLIGLGFRRVPDTRVYHVTKSKTKSNMTHPGIFEQFALYGKDIHIEGHEGEFDGYTVGAELSATIRHAHVKLKFSSPN